MTTYDYNDGVPAPNNNPSVDQPDMLINAQSIEGIIAVDHIGFRATDGGNHLQVHLPLYTSPTVVNGTLTQGSVIYGAAGVADTAHAQLNFKNPNATFPINFVKAWSLASSAGRDASQFFNVTSVTRTSLGHYSVVLPANTVTGTSFGVIIGQTLALSGFQMTTSYTITGAGTFDLLFFGGNAFQDPVSFNFMVIQL